MICGRPGWGGLHFYSKMILMPWVYFIGLAVAGYICISIFAQLVGPSSTSFWSAVVSTFKPLPFGVVMLGNALLGGALYYGFLSTNAAVPIAISIGVITSVAYSVSFLGVTITTTKLVGITMIIIGIYLLR